MTNLKVLNFTGLDSSINEIKSSNLPLIDLETPMTKEKLCRYCKYHSFAMHNLVWVCCCDSRFRYAHEYCLKKAIYEQASKYSNSDEIMNWMRCAECLVDYKIDYEQKFVFSCDKIKYLSKESPTTVYLTSVTSLLLYCVLIVMGLMLTNKITIVEMTETATTVVKAMVGISGTLATISLFMFLRSNFLLSKIELGKVHGIAYEYQPEEVFLGTDKVVLLCIGNVKKIVTLW